MTNSQLTTRQLVPKYHNRQLKTTGLSETEPDLVVGDHLGQPSHALGSCAAQQGNRRR